MTELKPCPFCGSHSVRVKRRKLLECQKEKEFFVECDYCGAMSHHFSNEKFAIENWNRRAGEKHGNWINRRPHLLQEYKECSACGNITEDYIIRHIAGGRFEQTDPKYCPNCGATMDEVIE